MTDNPQKALKEAEAWVASTKHTLVEAHSDEALTAVACAQAIHGIIRANDALMLHFFKVKPTRHDDAPMGFAKLVRENKILKEDERFKNLVSRAMREKSGADYGKQTFSHEDGKWYVEKSEEFIAALRRYVR
ncbi:hypothetical protein HYV43_04945 [Candidatus Micrarchaeota archaeon]|nr:hypothetical protein [Candidatus Micrarchaeota archaeon]